MGWFFDIACWLLYLWGIRTRDKFTMNTYLNIVDRFRLSHLTENWKVLGAQCVLQWSMIHYLGWNQVQINVYNKTLLPFYYQRIYSNNSQMSKLITYSYFAPQNLYIYKFWCKLLSQNFSDPHDFFLMVPP